MHSVIINRICTFFSLFFTALPKSVLWKKFSKLYNCISSAFLNSSIARWFCCENNKKPPFIVTVCRFPFFILEFISSKISSYYSNAIKKSIIISICGDYFHSFAALNTRFLGSFAIGSGLSYFILNLLSRNYSTKALFLIVFGVLLFYLNYNVTGFLNGSKLVTFIKKAVGFSDLDFDFFNENRVNKKTTLIIALILGIVSGVAASKALILLPLIPCALFGLFLILAYPIAGIYICAFIAPLVPTMALALLCILTTTAAVLNKLTVQGYKWETGSTGTAIILLLSVLFVSSVLSFAPVNSLMVWAMYFVFFIFYFVIINTITSKEQLISLLKLFVISGALVALYGVIQYVFKLDTQNAWIDQSMFADSTMRAYSTLENPNVLGEYLLLILPIATVFAINIKSPIITKTIYIGIFLLSAVCLVFTQSRGCWLGFILSTAIFVTFRNGKLWCILPFLALALPFVLPDTIMNRLMSIGDMSDSSTSYRVFIWYGTTAMLKDFWIGGIGMGEAAFASVYPFYSYNAIVAPHSHNLFLQLTVEAGIGALIIFISSMVCFFKNCANICAKNGKTTYNYMLSLALVSGVAGFLLQSMFDYTFYNYRVMAIFIMYLAFGAALKFISKESVSQ